MQEPIPGAEPSAALRAFGPVGHLLFRASKVLAITGGLIFVAIVIMSIVSWMPLAPFWSALLVP